MSSIAMPIATNKVLKPLPADVESDSKIAQSTNTSNAQTKNEPNRLLQELPSIIKGFQDKKGVQITPNCQYFTTEHTHFYGIHKLQQMQKDDAATTKIYAEMRQHVLKNMQSPATAKVIQVVGDSSPFSVEGTKKAKAFLSDPKILPHNAVVEYGYTGHTPQDGTRCVNAALADVIIGSGRVNQLLGNIVGYHSVQALKEWGCTGAALKHYVVVYGDDETNRKTGTVFGDDVTTSDYFADEMLMLDGGAQSFRQACNALLLNQPIRAISGLRTPERQAVEATVDGKTVRTLYFNATTFLQEIQSQIHQKPDITENELQTWYKDYFGQGKHYIADPKKPDYDTKQQLMDAAWNLFMQNKLYLKISQLFSHTVA